MPHRCRHTSGKTRTIGPHNYHGWPDGRPPITVHDTKGWVVRSVCEYGRCTELVCPVCGCNGWGGWGDIDCPCDDTVPFHGERRRQPVARKPSDHLTPKIRRARRNRRVKPEPNADRS